MRIDLKIDAVAIGNGTASRETEAFVKKLKVTLPIVMVNESGASVYSASEVAREEFPDQDVTVRGAVSIGRRLMDPLAELVKPGDKVVVVHTDITRATPNERILPVLLDELETAGIARQDISLLNGLGTHRPQTEAELRAMLGDRLVEGYRCLQHDAFDDTNLVSLGETSFGHPVRLNRTLLEADFKILTGFIEPHFFAGFSGGPKGIIPGCAGLKTVMSNHGTHNIGDPNCAFGVTFALFRTISAQASNVPELLSREMTTICKSSPPTSFQFVIFPW